MYILRINKNSRTCKEKLKTNLINVIKKLYYKFDLNFSNIKYVHTYINALKYVRNTNILIYFWHLKCKLYVRCHLIHEWKITKLFQNKSGLIILANRAKIN